MYSMNHRVLVDNVVFVDPPLCLLEVVRIVLAAQAHVLVQKPRMGTKARFRLVLCPILTSVSIFSGVNSINPAVVEVNRPNGCYEECSSDDLGYLSAYFSFPSRFWFINYLVCLQELTKTRYLNLTEKKIGFFFYKSLNNYVHQ